MAFAGGGGDWEVVNFDLESIVLFMDHPTLTYDTGLAHVNLVVAEDPLNQIHEDVLIDVEVVQWGYWPAERCRQPETAAPWSISKNHP